MTDKSKWIAEKIRKLRREGYKEDQAVAIAYRMSTDRGKRKTDR